MQAAIEQPCSRNDGCTTGLCSARKCKVKIECYFEIVLLFYVLAPGSLAGHSTFRVPASGMGLGFRLLHTVSSSPKTAAHPAICLRLVYQLLQARPNLGAECLRKDLCDTASAECQKGIGGDSSLRCRVDIPPVKLLFIHAIASMRMGQ